MLTSIQTLMTLSLFVLQIELSGMWFSGHTFTAKGQYQDRTTSKVISHNLKLLIKSPSFNEIGIQCKILKDDKEFKIDFLVKDTYLITISHIWCFLCPLIVCITCFTMSHCFVWLVVLIICQSYKSATKSTTKLNIIIHFI
jgi:hypothetical protein